MPSIEFLGVSKSFVRHSRGRQLLRMHLTALLRLSKKRAERIFDKVVEFSEIGDFIDEPLRTYSSGMMLRLAFSIAVNVDPDFLIVDELLAVGDQGFQVKCFGKIAELKRNGKSLVCVSHSPVVVQQLCERTLWLDHGEL